MSTAALQEIIDSNQNRSILVAYQFKSDAMRIQKRFAQAVSIDSKNAIEKWNRGDIPLLLAHPASAGHGLNLQFGGNIVVWFSLSYSLELYQQFNARLQR